MVDRERLKPIGPAIAAYYASESRHFNGSLSRTVDSFFSDFCFNCPAVLFAEAAVHSLPTEAVHAFMVSHVPSHHLSSTFDGISSDIVGVCHADELQFNFGYAFRYPQLFTDADRTYTKLLIQTMAEFVHHRSLPSVKSNSSQIAWPSSMEHEINLVQIKLSGLELSDSSIESRCESVWARLRPVLLKSTFKQSLHKLKDPDNWWIVAILVLLTLIVFGWLVHCCVRCSRRSKYEYV
jgi:carboxylesterase type B